MTVQQMPLALQLADFLGSGAPPLWALHDAATELRRLYEVNAELVEALNWALDCLRFDPAERPMAHKFWIEAKAALKKAKGESNAY